MAMEEELPGFCERGFVEVDLDAIRENMIHMKANIAPETKMIGVIKTDGYGHGSVPIAKHLEDLDFVWGYAIATPEEAIQLRKAGIKKPLLILGYTFPYCYENLVKYEIRPAVFREDSLDKLNRAAVKLRKPVSVHIKVDTGMSRIGITPDREGLAFIKRVLEYRMINIEGIFTHFARADEEDKTNAFEQLRIYQDFVKMAEEKLSIHIPMKHCSNSAGIIEMPQANMDVVRAGITLYGLYPSDEVKKDIVKLLPALSLYSKVVYVKKIQKGQSVSYGGTYTAESERVVATIPIGYGDGYPRTLSGKGYVLIHGKKAPILGRVCMDQFMVDVTDIPSVKEGDRVVLLGFDGNEHISAEELGRLSGRFNYELVCDLGKRLPRVYQKNKKISEYLEYI